MHHPPIPFGAGLHSSIPGPRFSEACDSVLVPVEWRRIEPQEGRYDWDAPDRLIEWALNQRLLIKAGPLLDLAPDGLPAWLATWCHDFLNLQSFVCDFVETAIGRYLGRVRHYEISARGNTGTHA